jgi:hypothetical protein
LTAAAFSGPFDIVPAITGPPAIVASLLSVLLGFTVLAAAMVTVFGLGAEAGAV